MQAVVVAGWGTAIATPYDGGQQGLKEFPDLRGKLACEIGQLHDRSLLG
jgi:hypothetical protein